MNEDIKFEKSLNFWFWLGVCFTVVILLSLIGGFLNAQTLEEPKEGIAEPSLIDSKLEFLKEDIIDSREVPVYELDEKTKLPVKTLLKEVQYYYAGDITDKIIKDEGDYSYTEQIGSNSYRIYTAPFIKDGDTYRTLEVATTSLMHWYEQVEMEAKDPISKLWDPLFIETHAQENIFSGGGDGYCKNSNTSANWANHYTDTACNQSADDSGTTMYVGLFTGGSGESYLTRNYYSFDLSALSGTVESANLNIYFSADKNNDTNNGYDYFTLVQATPDSFGNVVTGDWDTMGTTKLSDSGLDLGDITAGAWANIDLNEDGLALLDDFTETTLGMQIGFDIDNQAVTSANQYNQVETRTSEYAGTDYDPYLEITLGAETGTSTPTASTTPGLLLPMADGLSMMMGVLAGWLLMLLFIYALWPA